MEVSDNIRIKLKRGVDPGEPVVEAVVVERSGIKRAIKRVRVVGEHPVWRGAEFKRQDFTLVR